MAKPDAAERIAQSFSALEIPGGLYAGELKLLATRIRRELRKAFRAGVDAEWLMRNTNTGKEKELAAKYGLKL